jgi:hypothetical protein
MNNNNNLSSERRGRSTLYRELSRQYLRIKQLKKRGMVRYAKA